MRGAKRIFRVTVITAALLLFGCGGGGGHRNDVVETGISEMDNSSETDNSGVVRLSVPRKTLQNYPSSTLLMNLQCDDWSVEDTTPVNGDVISRGWQYQEHLLPGDYDVRIGLIDDLDEEVCSSSWVDFSVEPGVEIALEIDLVCIPVDTGQADMIVNFQEYPEFKKIQFSASSIEEDEGCTILSEDAGLTIDYDQSDELQLFVELDGETWDIIIGEFNPFGLQPGSHTLRVELKNMNNGLSTIKEFCIVVKNAEDITDPDIKKVSHRWIQDSCGVYHTAYEENGSCYLRNTTDPFGNWDAPISLGSCFDLSIVVDRGSSCNVHIRYHVANAGDLRYMRWNGSQIVDDYNVGDGWVWCNNLQLDDANNPHFFWSNSRAYHHGKNSSGNWDGISDVSAQAPSGWCPIGAIDAAGTWQAIFFRAISPPNSAAQIFQASSFDNGLSWTNTYKPFAQLESSGWYAWEPSTFLTHRSSNMAMVFRSNKSGEDDLWYSETTGSGWSEPELWRPLGLDTPVERIGGAIDPDEGNPVLLYFKERDDSTKVYYQFRCIGGDQHNPQPWSSSTGSTPESIFVTWEEDEDPRLFWKEDEIADTWFTTTLQPPSCF